MNEPISGKAIGVQWLDDICAPTFLEQLERRPMNMSMVRRMHVVAKAASSPECHQDRVVLARLSPGQSAVK